MSMAEQEPLQLPAQCEGRSSVSYRAVTVEPALFLVALSMSLSGAVLTQLFLVRSCEITLEMNISTCALLISHPDLPAAREVEAQSQPHAAVLQMAKMLIEACIPAVLSLFLGPWSDLHGRKPLLLWPILGFSVMFFMYTGFSLITSLPPHFLLLSSLPIAFSGGFISIISSAFSFMSDITVPEKRASSAHLFSIAGQFGYVAVFATCAICCLIAFFYTWFCIEESVPQRQLDCNSSGLSGLFDRRLFFNMMHTCSKRREHYGRAIIFLVISAVSTSVITMEGEAAVVYLFTRNKFEWDIHKHTTFSTVSMLVIVLGTVFGSILLSSWLQIPDDIFAMIAFFTKTVSAAIFAVAPAGWVMYLGCMFGLFGGVTGPLGRSIMSKTVPQQDVGTVFSLASLTQSLMPLASAPLYTMLYKATLLTFPAAFFVMSTVILGLDLILITIVFIIQLRFSKEKPKEVLMLERSPEVPQQ
ncbi:probable peptidoglycan muropeptide transporter SLC46 isoform X2 [Periplaneta americana]|uniref:probable peptidoglycan muropeptide transporter SLC46 isoform X2 n=1 Tax=Periplaneta americana TaxID=6978 RepID=UPI0037E70D38